VFCVCAVIFGGLYNDVLDQELEELLLQAYIFRWTESLKKVLKKGLKKVTELKKELKKVMKLKKVLKKVNSLKKALKKVMNSKKNSKK